MFKLSRTKGLSSGNKSDFNGAYQRLMTIKMNYYHVSNRPEEETG